MSKIGELMTFMTLSLQNTDGIDNRKISNLKWELEL